MKKASILTSVLLILAVLLCSCSPRISDDKIDDAYLKTLLKKASKVENVSYTIQTQVGDFTTESTYTIKNDKTKIITKNPNSNENVILLDQDSVTSYIVGDTKGTKTKYTSTYTYTPANYSGITDRISLSFVRREKIGSDSFIVATMKQENVDDSTIWIQEKNGLVFKDTTTRGEQDVLIDVTQIQYNKVKDKDLEIPSDIVIDDQTNE